MPEAIYLAELYLKFVGRERIQGRNLGGSAAASLRSINKGTETTSSASVTEVRTHKSTYTKGPARKVAGKRASQNKAA